jgi:hypothetical protein
LGLAHEVIEIVCFQVLLGACFEVSKQIGDVVGVAGAVCGVGERLPRGGAPLVHRRIVPRFRNEAPGAIERGRRRLSKGVDVPS